MEFWKEYKKKKMHLKSKLDVVVSPEFEQLPFSVQMQCLPLLSLYIHFVAVVALILVQQDIYNMIPT